MDYVNDRYKDVSTYSLNTSLNNKIENDCSLVKTAVCVLLIMKECISLSCVCYVMQQVDRMLYYFQVNII